jgi:exonuclease VII small subunit
MDQAVLERQWNRRAASLARQLNLGWWLERFNQLLLVGLLLFAVSLLAGRTWRADWMTTETVGLGLGGLLLVLAATAWILGRRRFADAGKGLVRLDEKLRLHNRLVSAAAKVGPWPDLPPDPLGVADFRWNLSRAWLPGLASLLLVAAAWWVPIPERSVSTAQVVEPSAWEQMEDWLATLEAEDLIEEEKIEELAGRIEELRDQPEEEWFSHSSLEATDSLEQSLGLEIRDLAEEMETLERNLSALQKFSSQMSEAAKEQARKEMEEALEALEGAGLPLNEALRKQLSEIDPSQLGKETLSNLSQEQLESLQQQLQKGSGALGSMEGLPEMGEGMGLGEGNPMLGMGEGEMPGAGGINRGRGDAPLFFDDKADDLGTDNLERVTNDDFSKAAIGEVLGLGETERELDESKAGPAAGGAVGSAGKGGEAVSRETLLPDEQAVLKRYFK